MKVLITGSAGFIGFHLAKKLIKEGCDVIGFDSINDYYDQSLKIDRNNILQKSKNYKFIKGQLEDDKLLKETFSKFNPSIVIHLAGQAGVRYSMIEPETYIKSNVIGSFNILEACKISNINHLLFASTSSIYGSNITLPFNESDKADKQISIYSATKKAAESLFHSYCHLYKIPTTILRFFTVYGPYGRPDMALFKFTKAILEDEQIDVYNNGKMLRDFTYIDDVVRSTSLLIKNIPKEKSNEQGFDAPYRIVNIGTSKKVTLLKLLETLEKVLGKNANYCFKPLQNGDMKETFSDSRYLKEITGFRPEFNLEQGITSFVDWYKDYYKVYKK